MAPSPHSFTVLHPVAPCSMSHEPTSHILTSPSPTSPCTPCLKSLCLYTLCSTSQTPCTYSHVPVSSPTPSLCVLCSCIPMFCSQHPSARVPMLCKSVSPSSMSTSHHPTSPTSHVPMSHIPCLCVPMSPMPLLPPACTPMSPDPPLSAPMPPVSRVPAHGGSQRREVLPSQTSHVPQAQDGAQGLQLWVEATATQLRPTARGWQVGPGDTEGHGDMEKCAIRQQSGILGPLYQCPPTISFLCPHVPVLPHPSVLMSPRVPLCLVALTSQSQTEGSGCCF